MTFRILMSAVLFCTLWGGASRGLGQCANCGSGSPGNTGGQYVMGADGVAVWTPNSGSAGNCGRCGHTSEVDFLSKSCNDCLYNWGDQYSDISALSPRFAPGWSVTADAIFLGRDVLNHIDFAALGADGPHVLTTDNAFPIEFNNGVRGKVSRAFGEAFRLEGVYMGQLNWQQTATVRDITPNIIGGFGALMSPISGFGSPTPIPGFDFNNLVTIGYTSDLQNAEINLLHRSGLCCNAIETAFVCGVRYLRLNETFDYLTAANAPGLLGALNMIDTETSNELIGGQLGVLSAYKVSERIYLECEFKAAMCQNIASQNTRYRNVNTVNGPFLGGSRTDAGDGSLAVVGDIHFAGNFQLSSAITLRLGYYAMWIDGLALAHENATTDFARLALGPGFLDDNGTVVYHGPQAGLTINW